MVVTYKLEAADVGAYWWHLTKCASPFRTQYRLGLVGMGAVMAVLAWWAPIPTEWRWTTCALAALAGIGLYVVSYRTILAATAAAFARLPGGAQFLGSYNLTVDGDGVREVTRTAEHFHRWEAVEDVSETVDHLFLRVGFGYAYVIPKRSFSSPEEALRFRETVAGHVARATREARPKSEGQQEKPGAGAAPDSKTKLR